MLALEHSTRLMQPTSLALLILATLFLPQQDAATPRTVDLRVLRKGSSLELNVVKTGWAEVRAALLESTGGGFSNQHAWSEACDAAGGVTLQLGATNYWSALCELASVTGGQLSIASVDGHGPRLQLNEDQRRVGEPVVAGAFCVTLQRSSHAIDFRIAAEPWIQGVEVTSYNALVLGGKVKKLEFSSENDGAYGGSSHQTQEAGFTLDPSAVGTGEVDVKASFDLVVRLEEDVFESKGDLKALKRRAEKAYGGRLKVVDLDLEDNDGRWGVELSAQVKKGGPVEEAWLVAPDGTSPKESGSVRDSDGTWILWFEREDLPEDPSSCRVRLSRLGEHLEHEVEVSFDGVHVFP